MSKHKNNPLTRRDAFSHWVSETVRWSDTDMVGHVNNIAFAAYCETGRSHFMRKVVDKDAEPRAMFLIAQITVDFLGEINWPAKVDIGTCVLDVGRSSARLGYGLFDGERCAGTGDSTMVMIDEASRKSLVIPEWVREYFAAYRLPATS